MRILFIAVVLNGVFLSNLCAQHSNAFTLRGSLSGKDTGMLYIRYFFKNKKITDSSEIKNGMFVFKGVLEEPTKAELSNNKNLFNKNNKNYVSDFYIEPTEMSMYLADNNFDKTKLQGSKTDVNYKSFYNELNPVLDKISWLQNEMKSSNEKSTLFTDSLVFYNIKSKQISLEFISNHRNSFISVKAIQDLIVYEIIGGDTGIILINSLNKEIQNYPTTQRIKQALIDALSSVPGHLARDFTRKDVNGKTIKLSSYKGKYVLLDFWASWCLPCRELTPHIKGIYKKYSGKGLTVISISCDSKYEDWLNAIRADSIQSFVNILSFTDSDMNFLKANDKVGDASWVGELRKQFNLMPIPVEILINKEGILVGRYGATEKLRLSMLDKKLIEIFDGDENPQQLK